MANINVWLYTENFKTNRFDLYKYSNDELLEVQSNSDEYRKTMSLMQHLECAFDIDENGIALCCGGVGFGLYVSFKILINEVSPFGRKRAIFGSTKRVWFPTVRGRKLTDQIVPAIRKLTTLLHVTIPESRLKLLDDNLPKAPKILAPIIITQHSVKVLSRNNETRRNTTEVNNEGK